MDFFSNLFTSRESPFPTEYDVTMLTIGVHRRSARGVWRIHGENLGEGDRDRRPEVTSAIPPPEEGLMVCFGLLLGDPLIVY